MYEVSKLCDEIIIMAEGRVAAQGTPEQILATAEESSLEDAFVTLSERVAQI